LIASIIMIILLDEHASGDISMLISSLEIL